MLSRSSNGSLGSGTGVRMDSSLELSGNYYQPMNTAGVTTAGNYEGGVAGGGARGTEYVSDTRTGSSQIKKTMSGTVGGARGHSYSPKNITRQIDYKYVSLLLLSSFSSLSPLSPPPPPLAMLLLLLFTCSYKEGSLDRSALKKKQLITKNLSGGWLTGGADSADRMRHSSPMRQESLVSLPPLSLSLFILSPPSYNFFIFCSHLLMNGRHGYRYQVITPDTLPPLPPPILAQLVSTVNYQLQAVSSLTTCLIMYFHSLLMITQGTAALGIYHHHRDHQEIITVASEERVRGSGL